MTPSPLSTATIARILVLAAGCVLHLAAAAATGQPPSPVLPNGIGSSIKTMYEVQGKGTAGKPVLVRLPELNSINDKSGMPVGMQQHIGRRSIATFGNSDGDFEMLAWTTGAPGARLDGGEHEARLEAGHPEPLVLGA